MTTLEELNQADCARFTSMLGHLFEHSPWIPKEAWARRPFASICDLHREMVMVVEEATYEDQLSLIQAHPRLAASEKVGASSAAEQQGAGLDVLSKGEALAFSRLNDVYDKRFGFPFVEAVKGKTAQQLYDSLAERINSTKEAEFNRALAEIFQIAWYRLEAFIKQQKGLV